MEPLQCRVGVVALQRVLEIDREALRLRHGITIDNSASVKQRIIDDVKTREPYSSGSSRRPPKMPPKMPRVIWRPSWLPAARIVLFITASATDSRGFPAAARFGVPLAG